MSKIDYVRSFQIEIQYQINPSICILKRKTDSIKRYNVMLRDVFLTSNSKFDAYWREP